MKTIHHVNIYHLMRLTEMKKLFWERAFSLVGTALVGIFIPIYLLYLGYSLSDIFFFLFLIGGFMALLMPFGFWCIGQLGANKTMVLGNAGYVVFFVLLLSLQYTDIPLWVLACFRAFYSAVYFPAFHANFTVARAHTKTGSQLGTLHAITLALNGLAPAAGGFLAIKYGLPAMYACAAVMVVVGSLPLLFGKDVLKGTSFNMRRVPFKHSGRDFLANGCYSVAGLVETVIWPLIISLVITSYAGIGALSSVVIVSSILISLYVGKREDKVGEKQYISHGIAVGALGGFGKLVAASPVGIFGVNIFSGASLAFLSNSFLSRYYKNADSAKHMLGYLFGMELLHAIIWAAYFLVLFLLSTMLPPKEVLLAGVLLGIPSLLGVRLVRLKVRGEVPVNP